MGGGAAGLVAVNKWSMPAVGLDGSSKNLVLVTENRRPSSRNWPAFPGWLGAGWSESGVRSGSTTGDVVGALARWGAWEGGSNHHRLAARTARMPPATAIRGQSAARIWYQRRLASELGPVDWAHRRRTSDWSRRRMPRGMGDAGSAACLRRAA